MGLENCEGQSNNTVCKCSSNVVAIAFLWFVMFSCSRECRCHRSYSPNVADPPMKRGAERKTLGGLTDGETGRGAFTHTPSNQPVSQPTNQPTDQLADLDKSRQQLKLFTQSNKALCIVSIVLSLVDDLRSIWSCGSHIFNTSSLLSSATSLSHSLSLNSLLP